MRFRDLDPNTDRCSLEQLWRAAMAPTWPLLPNGLDLIRAGLIAEAGDLVAGAVAFDEAGSVLLLLVHPNRQRRGVGTALLDAAMARLRTAGVRQVRLGSGGAGYIWPGVPTNLPEAVSFFEARDWTWDHVVSDLVCDLRSYAPPRGVYERASAAGVSLAVAEESDLTDVLIFEQRWFPQWVRWFLQPSRSILLARDSQAEVVGSLLFAGPGQCSTFWPMLGSDMGTIGCVGVAEPARGAGIGAALVVRASELLRDAGAGMCHIGWAWQPHFYERLGYQRWRDYVMARLRRA